MLNEEITHFRILSKLGSGGTGEVFKATDLDLNRTVALKFLNPSFSYDPQQRKRLLNEAEAASSLDHKNICTVYEVDETSDERIFIAMAYYEGETVKEKMNRGNVEFKEAIEIILQTAEGLNAAHEKSIVHRDIKPENIFITKNNVIKILDFGIAKMTDHTQITRLNATPGTVAYMSPEQIRGELIDNRTDIWSVGVLFYELLTGERPFKGESEPAIIYSILNEDPLELNRRIKNPPQNLQLILNRLLSKDRESRYMNLYDLIRDLNALIGEKITLKRRLSYKRKKIRSYAIIAMIIIVLVFSFLLMRKIIFPEGSAAKNKIALAIIPFENLTGDSTYNYLEKVIPSLLITSIEQTNYFNVSTLEELRDIIQSLPDRNISDLDRDSWFDVCKRKEVSVLIAGSFTKAGNKFINDLKLLNVDNKKLLSGIRTSGEGPESILLRQVDDMTKEIARDLGVLRISDVENLKPVSDVTTKSLKAYDFYLIGENEFMNLNFSRSRDLLRKAVKIDSTFAMAYTFLALSHSYLHNENEMKDAIEKAKRLIDRVSYKEQKIIEAQYAILAELDIKKYVNIYEELVKRYPDNKWFHICLGFGYERIGLTDKALEHKQKVLELQPRSHNTLNSLGYIFIKLKEYDRAEDCFSKLISYYPDDPNPYDSMGDLFLMKKDMEKSFYYYNQAFEKSYESGSQLKIAYLFALRQNFIEAVRWIDKRLETAPSEGNKSIAYLWHGFYNYLLTDFEKAFLDFSEAEKLAKKIGDDLLLSNIYCLMAWLELERENISAGRRFIKEWIGIQNGLRSDLPDRIVLEKIIYGQWADLISSAEQVDQNNDSRISELMSKVVYYDSLRFSFLLDMLRMKKQFLAGDFEEVLNINTKSYLPEMRMDYNLIKYNLPLETDLHARSWERLGNISGAIQEYKNLATFSPKRDDLRIPNPVYHKRLAELYERNGLVAEAAIEYDIYKRILGMKTKMNLP